MAKSNPLFVDSTKLQGDAIGSQFELKKVLIYDDENLAVIITNHLGNSQRVFMKMNENGDFEARALLNHQKTITYQFVIERAGRRILQSAPKQIRAQYAIIDEWEPLRSRGRVLAGNMNPDEIPTMSPATAVAAVTPVATATPATGADWPAESARNVKSLIEKWGL